MDSAADRSCSKCNSRGRTWQVSDSIQTHKARLAQTLLQCCRRVGLVVVVVAVVVVVVVAEIYVPRRRICCESRLRL